MVQFRTCVRVAAAAAGFSTLLILAFSPALVPLQSEAQVARSQCVVITHTLFVGSRDYFTGGDVTKLQQFLTVQGYYRGLAIGIFGPVTRRAVTAFQADHGITPIGVVGPRTRAAIQSVSCATVYPPPSEGVSIQSLVPTSGPIGSAVTVYGSGFTADNTVLFDAGAIAHVRSQNGTTLTFTVPSALNPECYYSYPYCLMPARQVVPGTYRVAVKNQNGTSNEATFTVASQSAMPHITAISPQRASYGATVTITGSGFSHAGAIHFYQRGEAFGTTGSGTASSDGTSITFPLPQWVGTFCRLGLYCIALAKELPSGEYTIAVENASGTSNQIGFTVGGGATGHPPSITGLSGPSSLAAGIQGTWAVNAVSGGGELTYSVVWGDEHLYYPYATASASARYQTAASFTHTYNYRGTFTPRFTVSNDAGQSASASATVMVY